MNWHKRYLQQAAWTRDLRAYLFQKVGVAAARRILEVGCGTGVILGELAERNPRLGISTSFHGLDLASAALAQCHVHVPTAYLTRAEAIYLPYADHTFEITFCHFFLLWIKAPLQALKEMKRVTRSPGHVLILAEPDYTRRVDQPDELALLGKRQTQALEKQGADVALGSRLPQLCEQAGLAIVESGVIRPWSAQALTPDDVDGEWDVLQADLAEVMPSNEMERMKALDMRARRLGKRLLYVPTYYAWGQV